MTASQSHENCNHPATKSGRAKCRAARKATNLTALNTAREEVAALVASYYDLTGDLEEIMAGLHRVNAEITASYYDGTGDAEEIIAAAHRYVW